VFAGIGALDHREPVWMSHGDRVTALPAGFHVIATSEGAPFAAIADETRKIYGVQFHPEVVHTPRGAQLLKNFTHGVAGLTGDWTMAAYRDEQIAKIREQVGDAKVVCGLSGGVDSSVAAVLIHEAIGDQLTCVFVDTGLLRKDEAKQVTTLFREHYNIPLVHVDASKEFLGELAGISDPETKRKTIGRVFIEIFDREAAKIEGAAFLAQGTLYPGVQGDARTYEKVLALRAVTSTDGMTADFYQFPWDVLAKTATRIINEVRGVNRVVYDVTSKPPGTIEWE